MGGTAIHVFHAWAPRIRDLILARAPARKVTAWTDPDAFREGLPDVEVLFATAPPRDAWRSARRLRLVQALGAGVDDLLPAPHLSPRVPLACARGIFAPEAAEHAIAMMLALARELPTVVRRQRAHTFRQFPVETLAGRTLGLVGLGEIGRRVARAAGALGMRVVGVCRRPRRIPNVERVVSERGLPEVVKVADFLVVCVPRTRRTRGLVDRAMLARLPRGARVVVLGRGGVVDEAALRAALEAGRLGGAALDVFAEEPLARDSPWWSTPHTIVTPHHAGYGLRYLERVVDRLLENVGRIERGRPVLGLVDRAAGY